MNNSENNYRSILSKYLDQINDEIILLQSQNNALISMITRSEKRVERLRIEREQVMQELKNRVERKETKLEGSTKEFLDDRIENITKKADTSNQRVAELEQLRKNATSRYTKARLQRRIVHERKKIARLKGAKNLISDVQKAIIMPRYKLEKYRLKKYAKRQGNVNYFTNKLQKTTTKQQALKPEENLVDNIKDKYYDFKGKRYAKKLEKSTKLLQKLQQSGMQNRILGANAVAMNKADLNRLRQRLHQAMEKTGFKLRQPENITAQTLADESAKSRTSLQQTNQTLKAA